MSTFSNALSNYVNSINANHKIFAMTFLLMSFLMVMSFVGVIVYLNVRRCRHFQKANDEEKSKSFTFHENAHFLPDLVPREKCGNMSILSDNRANDTIRQDADNVHDDFEFYEIRSDVSTEFCNVIETQVKWETLIKQNVLKVPPKATKTPKTNNATMPRKYSNVRRNLLDEFNFTEISTM